MATRGVDRSGPTASSGRSRSPSASLPGEGPIETLLEVHNGFGYVVIVANGVAGLVALAAWQWPRVRGWWVWAITVAAEVGLLAQVVLGVVLVASDRFTTTNLHMFYGFVSFLAVGLAFQYRDHFRQGADAPRWRSLELFYGLVGLFLMGMSIRAVIEVAA